MASSRKKHGVGRVYAILCLKNGRLLVGREGERGNRVRDHFNALRRNGHLTPKLQADWNRYGADAFMAAYIVRLGMSPVDASHEDDCIERLRSHVPRRGYNRMLRGRWTDEARRDEAARRRRRKRPAGDDSE